MKNHSLYCRWKQMRKRCNGVGSKYYPYYGARGIKVCPEWDDFWKFQEWAFKNGYEEKLTLDRVDNDKGYSPENCRWATLEEQQHNTRKSVLATWKGETRCLSDWAKVLGVHPSTIRYHAKKQQTRIVDIILKRLQETEVSR